MRVAPVQNLDEIVTEARSLLLAGASPDLLAETLQKSVNEGLTTWLAKSTIPLDLATSSWGALRQPASSYVPYVAAAGLAGMALHTRKKKKEAEARERRSLQRRARENELDRTLERIRGTRPARTTQRGSSGSPISSGYDYDDEY